MSGDKEWKGEVVCSICGHTQQATVEIPKWAQEPIVPIECEDCGNLACNYDTDFNSGEGEEFV